VSSSILTGILLQIAEQFLGIYVCDVDKKEKLGKGWRKANIMESMTWLRRIDPNEFWENPTNP